MKWVSFVQTSDGELHRDYLVATRHAERRYGLALSKTAHAIIQKADKYLTLQEYLDANLPVFAELQALKTDITLERREDE